MSRLSLFLRDYKHERLFKCRFSIIQNLYLCLCYYLTTSDMFQLFVISFYIQTINSSMGYKIMEKLRYLPLLPALNYTHTKPLMKNNFLMYESGSSYAGTSISYRPFRNDIRQPISGPDWPSGAQAAFSDGLDRK